MMCDVLQVARKLSNLEEVNWGPSSDHNTSGTAV